MPVYDTSWEPENGPLWIEKDHSRNRELILILIGLFFIALGVGFTVHLHLSMMECSSQLIAVEQRIDAARKKTQLLIAEISYLQRAARIERLARRQLAMQEPQEGQIIYLSPAGQSARK